MATAGRVEVKMVDGPLPAAADLAVLGAGAVVQFEGVVRPLEAGRELGALIYEDYPPMTTRELHALATALTDRHQLLELRLLHSRGRVPVGACSFRVQVAAPHRREALAAVTELVDRMKQEVPLWKVPEWPDSAGTR